MTEPIGPKWDWDPLVHKLRRQGTTLAGLWSEGAEEIWKQIEAKRGPIEQKAREALRAEIGMSLLTAQATIKVASETSDSIREKVAVLQATEIHAISAEGSLLLEGDRAREEDKELKGMLARMEELKASGEFTMDNAEAREIHARATDIMTRYSGESEGAKELRKVQSILEAGVETVERGRVMMQILHGKLEEELEKLDRLSCSITPKETNG